MAYFLTSLVASRLAARWADKDGRHRKFAIIGLAFSGIGTALPLFGSGALWLVLSVVIVGVAQAIGGPSRGAIMLEECAHLTQALQFLRARNLSRARAVRRIGGTALCRSYRAVLGLQAIGLHSRHDGPGGSGCLYDFNQNERHARRAGAIGRTRMIDTRSVGGWILTLVMACLCLSQVALADAVSGQPAATKQFRVYMATWRGCEEVCIAFKQYLVGRGLSVEFIDRSAGSKTEALPAMVAEARQLKPDLIATWGTGVTLAFVGPYDATDTSPYITDIPVVYYYVTDPVGSKIAKSADTSGRRNVAGGLYAVSSETLLLAMQSYRPVKKIGLIYARDEGNSVAAKDEMKAAAKRLGVATVEYELPLGADGHPSLLDIAGGVAKLVAEKPDFISFGSSSFLRANIKLLARLLNDAKVPLFCSGESLMSEGDCLLGLTGSLRSIGQISAHQAYRILDEGIAAGDLPTQKLSRFVMSVKMPVALELELYPPMTILRYADLLDK